MEKPLFVTGQGPRRGRLQYLPPDHPKRLAQGRNGGIEPGKPHRSPRLNGDRKGPREVALPLLVSRLLNARAVPSESPQLGR